MNCVFGNPLSEEQLVMAVDGEADTEVQNHLRQCPYCTAQLDRLRQFEQRLYARLHPDSQVLLDLHYDLLPDQEAVLIQNHVQYCQVCQEIIANFEAMPAAQAAPAAPRVVQRPGAGDLLQGIIAQLIPRSRPGVAALGNQDESFVAEADGVRLFIHYQMQGDTGVLDGQVVVADQAAWEGAVAALTPLDEAQAPLLSTLLDDLGQFGYPQVPRGLYKLRVTSLSGAVITLYDLHLR